MSAARRPNRKDVLAAIQKFFAPVDIYGEHVELELVEDGEGGWAFWFHEGDTTSYVHEDLTIEWYGVSPDCERKP